MGGSLVTLMMLKVIGFIVLNERKLKVFKSNRIPLNYKTFKFNRKLFCINNSMFNLQKQNKYLVLSLICLPKELSAIRQRDFFLSFHKAQVKNKFYRTNAFLSTNSDVRMPKLQHEEPSAELHRR